MDDLGVGGHVGRTAESDGIVLLASQQNDQIGIPDLGSCPVQSPLKKSKAVGMAVGQQTPGLSFGQHGYAGGFGKLLEGFGIVGVAGGVSGDGVGALGLAH